MVHVEDRACALVFLRRPASSADLACVVLRFTSSFVSRARMPLCSLASSARFSLLLLCAQVDSYATILLVKRRLLAGRRIRLTFVSIDGAGSSPAAASSVLVLFFWSFLQVPWPR